MSLTAEDQLTLATVIAEQNERIAALKATVEHMDAICHTRADRISILEAQKSSIWNQYQYAEAGVKVLETLEAEYKRLVGNFEALGRDWAEALGWINRLQEWSPLDDNEVAELKLLTEKHK